MSTPREVKQFIRSLKNKPEGPLFSPWYDQDEQHDRYKKAPNVRKKQLEQYLNQRLGKAKLLLIAEALGYQGGHFTGMAMTSERILLGYQEEKYGVIPSDVFTGLEPERTTHTDVNEKGMSEPTATIVWGALKEMQIDPYEVVLWNAVPWHPYKPEKGLLSNRTPRADEMAAGLKLLPKFRALFPQAAPVAVGRKCEELMDELGWDYEAVRHPANGGAPKFRRQLQDLAGF